MNENTNFNSFNSSVPYNTGRLRKSASRFTPLRTPNRFPPAIVYQLHVIHLIYYNVFIHCLSSIKVVIWSFIPWTKIPLSSVYIVQFLAQWMDGFFFNRIPMRCGVAVQQIKRELSWLSTFAERLCHLLHFWLTCSHGFENGATAGSSMCGFYTQNWLYF